MTKKSKSKHSRKPRKKSKVDAAVTAVTKRDESLESKMQRLQLGVGTEDDMLEEAIKLAAAERKKMEADEARMNCRHGRKSDEYIESFFRAFQMAFIEASDKTRGRTSSYKIFETAYNYTLSDFANVWSDSTNMAKVVQLFTAIRTTYYLRGVKNRARCFAYFTNLFNNLHKWRSTKFKRCVTTLKSSSCTKATTTQLLASSKIAFLVHVWIRFAKK